VTMVHLVAEMQPRPSTAYRLISARDALYRPQETDAHARRWGATIRRDTPREMLKQNLLIRFQAMRSTQADLRTLNASHQRHAAWLCFSDRDSITSNCLMNSHLGSGQADAMGAVHAGSMFASHSRTESSTLPESSGRLPRSVTAVRIGQRAEIEATLAGYLDATRLVCSALAAPHFGEKLLAKASSWNDGLILEPMANGRYIGQDRWIDGRLAAQRWWAQAPR